MENQFIAHRNAQGNQQNLIDHLHGTAEKAKAFAEKFGASDYAALCAILHDIGKYSEKFQQRIRGSSIFTDHATAGAKEVVNTLGLAGRLLAYCVAGHHTGLPDGGSVTDTGDEPTLSGRLIKTIEPFEVYKNEINLKSWVPQYPPLLRPIGSQGFSYAFFTRMLYSCLVDADYLDTETFMSGARKSNYEDISTLTERLEQYIRKFENPKNEINRYRTEILHRCIQKADYPKGLYTMTVPTGGGKTIASLAFALKHAKTHGMDRVIYVIPYTSIIEQNAVVFKEIVGVENVLEHHSNYAFEQENEIDSIQKLATENWDMPIVVTTTVQFFESLFSNRSSHCRKLHNMANSVIVFDEAQMLPLPYLKPCIHCISELVHNYQSTVVLCSATQPALDGLFPEELKIQELCGETKRFYELFRRTRIENIGELSNEELAQKLNEQNQVLCIVGTRKQAQAVYELLEQEGSYHLSTLMYPLHRKQVLCEIRTRLHNGQACRVVSTSLIEAGVDVDFPVVYRSQSGLDSIIQAAGRCNREGKSELSPVYIFQPSPEYRKNLPHMLERPTSIALSIANQFADIGSPQAISAYFQLLYQIEGEGLDLHSIVKRFDDGVKNGLNFPFTKVSEEFKLIENSTFTVIIPLEERVQELIQRLRSGERNRDLMRELQQYSVSVYEPHFKALYGTGSLELLENEIALLVNPDKYSKNTGLNSSTESGQGVFF